MRNNWFQLSQDMRVRGALEPLGVKEAIRPEWLKGRIYGNWSGPICILR